MKPFTKIWAVLFLPLTVIYSVISGAKNKLYNSGIFKPKKVNVPVISIGNLTVGGTGKTPIVAFLANELTHRGLKVGIVSRGYGRQSKGTVWVAREGRILTDAILGGDEPVELAATTKNTTIVVGETRFEAATELLDKIKIDVLLVDDGMQHRKFHRDIDIIVQDVFSASNWKFQLPSGPFRESWKNVKRADIVVWTKWDSAPVTKLLDSWKSESNQPHYWAQFIPQSFFYVRENREVELSDFSGHSVTAFCGIGNPDQFKQDLEKLNIILSGFKSFHDHHTYTKHDLLTILELHKEYKSKWIVTTAKDYYRLSAAQTGTDFMKQLPFIILKGQISLSDGNEKLVDFIVSKFKSNLII